MAALRSLEVTPVLREFEVCPVSFQYMALAAGFNLASEDLRSVGLVVHGLAYMRWGFWAGD